MNSSTVATRSHPGGQEELTLPGNGSSHGTRPPTRAESQLQPRELDPLGNPAEVRNTSQTCKQCQMVTPKSLHPTVSRPVTMNADFAHAAFHMWLPHKQHIFISVPHQKQQGNCLGFQGDRGGSFIHKCGPGLRRANKVAFEENRRRQITSTPTRRAASNTKDPAM